MAAESNGVLTLLEDANAITNENASIQQVGDNLDLIAEERCVNLEQFSIDLAAESDENKLCNNDSDYSGVASQSNDSCNSKLCEASNTKVDIHGNNISVASEGYSTGHEDFSGLEDAPVSMESFAPRDYASDDEYFEEFHLPNTHENAFVRHQSFRKKVKLTPIIAPDAEKIEGLLRTGSFRRHDSIRRKILHEEQESDLDDTDSATSLSEQLQQDIEEIEQIILSESQTNNDASSEGGRKINFSTPMHGNVPTDGAIKSSPPFTELDLSEDNSLSFEQITLMKIKDCLDITKYRNIYHLSGRLQDILSPVEIEEILNNSEKYSSLLTAEVLNALSMSLHETSINDDENQRLSTDAVTLDKSSEIYNSCASSLDLKVIQAPKLDLNAIDDTMDDSEITEISDIEIPSSSDYLNSSGLMEDSLDCKKHQRRISVEGLSFTSVSCYSAPSVASEAISQEIISPSSYPSHFSHPLADNTFPPPPPDLIPESDDAMEENHWRNVVIAGDWKRIDMKAVHLYKSFISYGGFSESGSQVILVSAPLLPKRSLKEYNYIMDNLFIYALSILEQLVSEDYILVYLAGGRATNGPGFHWMRRAYDMIDRRIRKNMKQLLIVHPSLWARTLVVLAKPFISSKFYRKLRFVYSLTELAQVVPLNSIPIPETIKQLDFELMINEKKRAKRNRQAL